MGFDRAAGQMTLDVLAVEDDPAVASAVAMVLRGPGCNLTLASNASEAFAAMERHPREFDVVLTDNNMPGLPGGEFVRRLYENNFAGRIVVLSGYVGPQQEAEYRKMGVSIMMPKPFGVTELRNAVGL